MSIGKFLFTIVALIATVLFSACNNELPKNYKKIDGITSTGEAVMVMDTAMLSSKLEGIAADGTIVFNNLAIEDMPEKGDIICSAPSRNAPQGFLYRVKEVTTTGSKTTVATEFATIEEAVEEADVDQTFDLTVIDVEEVEGVEIEELPETYSSQLRVASISAGVKLNIDKPIDENLHIKGVIELKTSVRCEIKLGFFKLNRFLLTTQPKFKAQLAATIEGKVEKDITFPITTMNCAPVTFWAGILPVVFTPKISIVGVLTTKGEVKLHATLVDWDYSYTFGVRYQNGTLSAISENTSKPAKYMEDVQFVLTGEMKLQPKLSYRYDLYNSGSYAGLLGDFYAKLKVQDNVGSDIKLAFSCGLDFGADAQLKVLGYKLGSLKVNFLSFEWLIWEKKWGLAENDPDFWKPKKGDVYVAGRSYIEPGYHFATIWKNGIEQKLPLTNGANQAYASFIYVYGNDVFIVGYELNAQGKYIAKFWKNGIVQNLTDGTTNAMANSVFVSDNDVYIAGWEVEKQNFQIYQVAQVWKNGIAQNLSEGTSHARANSVYVTGNNIYVVGSEGGAGANRDVAKLWKNGIAQNLSDGTDDAEACSVFVSGNDVYVVGAEMDGKHGYYNGVAKFWKNGIAQNLTDGTRHAWASSVYVYKNDVYVAGFEVNTQYYQVAQVWKNGEAQNLIEIQNPGEAHSVYVSGSDVYVAGWEDSIAIIWKNGIAQNLGNGYAQSVFVVE